MCHTRTTRHAADPAGAFAIQTSIFAARSACAGAYASPPSTVLIVLSSTSAKPCHAPFFE